MLSAISAFFVAFDSLADNLLPGDTNRSDDIFVHDRKTGRTERVSVDSAGNQGNSDVAFLPAISADGRFVAFWSGATNLVPGATNRSGDIFVHDRRTGVTERVSVDSAGNEANDFSVDPAISGNGRFVTFVSVADNLVPGDTNRTADIFVHDRKTGVTERVSVDSAGNQGNSVSLYGPSISANGRLVAYVSLAARGAGEEIFVHDRETGATERVDVDSAGNQANNPSFSTAIAANGRHVVFASAADNLVPGDTNRHSDIFVHDLAGK